MKFKVLNYIKILKKLGFFSTLKFQFNYIFLVLYGALVLRRCRQSLGLSFLMSLKVFKYFDFNKYVFQTKYWLCSGYSFLDFSNVQLKYNFLKSESGFLLEYRLVNFLHEWVLRRKDLVRFILMKKIKTRGTFGFSGTSRNRKFLKRGWSPVIKKKFNGYLYSFSFYLNFLNFSKLLLLGFVKFPLIYHSLFQSISKRQSVSSAFLGELEAPGKFLRFFNNCFYLFGLYVCSSYFSDLVTGYFLTWYKKNVNIFFVRDKWEISFLYKRLRFGGFFYTLQFSNSLVGCIFNFLLFFLYFLIIYKLFRIIPLKLVMSCLVITEKVYFGSYFALNNLKKDLFIGLKAKPELMSSVRRLFVFTYLSFYLYNIYFTYAYFVHYTEYFIMLNKFNYFGLLLVFQCQSHFFTKSRRKRQLRIKRLCGVQKRLSVKHRALPIINGDVNSLSGYANYRVDFIRWDFQGISFLEDIFEGAVNYKL